MVKPLSVMLALTLLIAACGNEGGSQDDPPSSGGGPGLSVSEAIGGDADGPVLVNGYLFVDSEGEVTLAEMILESHPPQPGGATLEVEGLDLEEVEGLQNDQGRSWTNEIIQVLGRVQGDLLVVDTAMSG